MKASLPRAPKLLIAVLVASLASPLAFATTTTYDFETGAQAWGKLEPQTNSEVGWYAGSPSPHVRFDCAREDPADEFFVRFIGTFSSDTAFTVTAKTMITQNGAVGHHAFPLGLEKEYVTNWPAGSGVAADLPYFWYEAGSGSSGTMHMRYLDFVAIARIDATVTVSTNTEYHLYINNNPVTHALTMKVRDQWDSDLLSRTYTIGSNPNDSFSNIIRAGVACEGNGGSAGTNVIGWTDDVVITTVDLPTAPTINSIGCPASSPKHGIRIAWSGAGNGGGTIQEYGIRIDGGGTDTLVSGSSSSYTDYPLWASGSHTYEVRARNEAGWSPYSGGASASPCDQETPTVSGAPTTVSWIGTTSYTVQGVSWSDQTPGIGYSGLDDDPTYSIGRTSGATDVSGGWFALSPAPADNGPGTWTNQFTFNGLVEGDNYANIRMDDRAGNLLTTNGAFLLKVDTVFPTLASGMVSVPSGSTWTSSSGLSLSGAQFTDATSGFQNYARYQVTQSLTVPTSGWNSFPGALPSTGTKTWNIPSFTITPVGQGHNYVWFEVKDQTGNVLRAAAYDYKYDSAGDAISNLGVKASCGGASLPESQWQTDTTPCFEWTSTPVASPITAHRYSINLNSAAAPNVEIGAGTSFQPTALANGKWYFQVQTKDSAGNWGPVAGPKILWVDSSGPAGPSSAIVQPWANQNLILRDACFQDPHVGLSTTPPSEAKYFMGSTPTSSDRIAPTTMTSQPSSGQTTNWCPPGFSVTAGALAQGVNHVGIRTCDTLAHCTDTPSYQLRYDTVAETVTGLTAKVAIQGATIPQNTWQTDNTPRYEWNAPTSTSPLAGYRYTLSQSSSVAPSNSASYTESFDLGGTAWVYLGQWHATGRRGYSAPTALWYGQDVSGTYDTPGVSNSGTATSPPILVPTNSPKLVFRSWYQTESTGTAFDKKLVQVSTNAGLSWTQVGQVSGTMNAWTTQTISLAPYAGQTILLRFAFDTVDSTANGFEGWYVDDVQVRGETGTLITDTFLDRAFSALSDGTWHFKVLAEDTAGNVGAPTAAYVIKVDATPPTLPTVTSSTHANPALFYSARSLSVCWSSTDASSGLDGFSYDLVDAGTGTPLDTAEKDVEETTTCASYADLLPWHQYWFRVAAVDNLGQWSQVRTFAVNVDDVEPEVESTTPAAPSINPFQEIRVDYNELDGSLDPGLLTRVDVPMVKLFIEDEDVVARWAGLCPPDGVACQVEVTEDFVRYIPAVPWVPGVYRARVELQDTVQGTNFLAHEWEFTIL